MRIAVVLKDRCQPKRCNLECIKYCPKVRTGVEVIVQGEDGKPNVSEELCVGCGICVNKCPFEAIKIIGLPEELEGELVHQYGKNDFRLYRLPVPKEGLVTGILGQNGIGKSTAIKLLSADQIPNLGEYEEPPSREEVLEHFKGTELHNYLESLYTGSISTAMKPQYVDKLPQEHSGMVRDLLKEVAERLSVEEIVSLLDLEGAVDMDIRNISGGELQRVAIGATLAKDSDVYFFDEPSSYLDIHQRIKVAKVINDLSQEKQVVVIEHDLAILDFLAHNVYLVYGTEGAFGVFAHPRKVRAAINAYLDGYLREENIRFRETSIEFESRPPRDQWGGSTLIKFDHLTVEYPTFTLEVEPGKINSGETGGVVGPNAIGKTTFVKVLAGVEEPSEGSMERKVVVSYKPQYIDSDYSGTVTDLFQDQAQDFFRSGFFDSEIAQPLSLKYLLQKRISNLSGGELQRVAVALCLAREADLYLLDEPSAYLDSYQRMEVAKTIRRVMEKRKHSALVVDHDMYFLDMVSDSMMVFHGEPGKHGTGEGPFDLRTGMNMFLENVDITFRRDNQTKRPRINKPDSRLDKEQKSKGEYYYE